MRTNPGATIEWLINGFTAGLGTAGTAELGVRIRDGAGNNTLARTTLGIIEDIVVGDQAVYRKTLVAPTTAGQFWLIADDGDTTVTEELVVSHSASEPITPNGRDLCAIADVLRYVPGYPGGHDATDDQIAALITAESESIHDETRRLIVPATAQPETRVYPLDTYGWLRTVEIDDLAGTDDLVVELLDRNGDTAETLDTGDYRPLYGTRRQPASAWEPITTIEFVGAIWGRFLTIEQAFAVTGTFGFPQIPPFIREACAKRVILRYASDVASAGTQLAAAIQDVNLAGLFASSRDDVERLKRTVLVS